jgi:hypothetical protein
MGGWIASFFIRTASIGLPYGSNKSLGESPSCLDGIFDRDGGRKGATSMTDNPHRSAARTQFVLANQAATAAENATKDPALQNISKATTYYSAATGEMLLLILERIERLHHKIDRIEKKLGSVGTGNVW